MRKLIISILGVIFFFSTNSFAAPHYARRLCSKHGYTCIRVRRGDTWQKLWPDAQKRRIVMRLNRMNTRLYPGLMIAVPKKLVSMTHMDISPLPYSVASKGRKFIVVSLSKHAFGAYDASGYLVHWGPISGGRGYCPDINRACRTPRGRFYIYRKGTAACESSVYPVPEGGAPMPYCMYFYRGYAMHSSHLPGYHASHGCVRMFYEDAEWLNKNFIRSGKKGTLVIVK